MTTFVRQPHPLRARIGAQVLRHALHVARIAGPIAGLIAGLLGSAAAPAAPSSPAHMLTEAESAAVEGLPFFAAVDLGLRTAASVSASAFGKGNPKLVVQRKSGADAAVHASLPGDLLPMLPPQPDPAVLFDFTTIGDSVQAWATMTANGTPHLLLRGFGDFQADVAASWTAVHTLAGSTSKELVLRIVVPAVSVGGDTDDPATPWWRSRMRAEVLVNGFPVWSTEALRLGMDYKSVLMNSTVKRRLVVLQQFGSPLAFPQDDEDTRTDNDSGDGTSDTPSERKVVFLGLGRHEPGARVEISMVLRGTAFAQPSFGQTTDHRCQAKADNTFACSRASMGVYGGSADGPRLYLVP